MASITALCHCLFPLSLISLVLGMNGGNILPEIMDLHLYSPGNDFLTFADLTPLLLRTTPALPAHPRALPGASTRKVEKGGKKATRIISSWRSNRHKKFIVFLER